MKTVVTVRNSFGRTSRWTPEGPQVPIERRLRVAGPFDGCPRAGEEIGGAPPATRGRVEESLTEREDQETPIQARTLVEAPEETFANRAKGVGE